MADGFVLNISETMLKRLESADEKIEKIGRTSVTAMEKVKTAFETKGVAGVNAFITALNNAQVELSKFKDVKVGLSLDPNALENLKKQIASVSGANVGVNVGGVQGGGTLPEGFQDTLKTLISEVGKLSAALTEAVKKKKELTEGSTKGAKNSVSDVDKEIKEYKRLSDELTRIEKQMYSLKKTQIDLRNSGKVTADLEQKYTEQWRRLNNRKFDVINEMSALEKKHGRELGDIQRKRGSESVALAQKEEKDKQRIRANELKDYERIYSRMLELNRLLYENERNKRSTKDPKLQFQYYNERLNLMQEYNSLFSQRKNMEQKLGNEVISIQNKFRQQEIALERKKQEDKINEVRRALQRRRDIEARWERRNARITEQQRTTYQGSMDYSRNAKSINEQIQAIKYLQNARNNLQRTDANYTVQVRTLNREIERQQKQLEKLGAASGIVARNHRNLMDISGQLGRSFALLFSVSQITQYISKIVNIRKEMELQQRALQVLIQDMDAANKLWNQTIDLAVKSPFRVKELITYTKQLAAYRIETDKLHDTTRRLADVSAGLGVDMQRLILAFGQVKAASFLRGTELRQFTEAGIPMLEELAKYFGEIQGRAISVAEVFDMISKRMVTFTDVENVFHRMTDAGGTFYKMQEEQSKTVAGMLSNLGDSMDLALNEMGKASDSIIKTFINIAKSLFDNWEKVGSILKTGLKYLLLWKVTQFIINKNVIGLAKNQIISLKNIVLQNAAYDVQTRKIKILRSLQNTLANTLGGNLNKIFLQNAAYDAQTRKLKVIRTLFNTMKNSPNFIAVALIAVASLLTKIVTKVIQYRKEVNRVVKKHEELNKSLNELTADFSSLFDKGATELDDYKDKLQQLADFARQKYDFKVDIQFENLETIAEVSEKFDELKEKILSFNNISLAIDISYVERNEGRFGLGWFQDFLDKDLKELSEANSAIRQTLQSISNKMASTMKDVYEKDYYEALKDKSVQELLEMGNELEIRDVDSLLEDFKNIKQGFTNVVDFTEDELSRLSSLDIENLGFDRLLEKYDISLSGDQQQRLREVINNLSEYEIEASKLADKTKDVNDEIVKSFSSQKADESEYDYHQRRIEGLRAIRAEYQELLDNARDAKDRTMYESDVNYAQRKLYESTGIDFSTYDAMVEELYKYETDQDEAYKELEKWFKSFDPSIANKINTELLESPLEFDTKELLETLFKQRDEVNLFNTIRTELEKRNMTTNEDLINSVIDILKADNEVGTDMLNRLNDVLKKQYIEDKISEDIRASLKNIAIDKEYDDLILNDMLTQAEKYFRENELIQNGVVVREKLELDLIPDIVLKKPEDFIGLKPWQKDFNNILSDFTNQLIDANDDKLETEAILNFNILPIAEDMSGYATDQAKKQKEVNDVLEERKKLLEDIKSAETIEEKSAYSNIDVQALEKEVFLLQMLSDWFGKEQDKKGSRSKKKEINDMISIIRQLYEEYQKLSKAMSATEAKAKVSGDFADAADEYGLNIAGIDFTNLQGVLEELQKLEPQAKEAGKDAMKELSKAIGETKVELELLAYVKAREDFDDKIKEMFSGYEMSLELDKLNIPKTWAEKFFGVKVFDLDEIKSELNKELKELDDADADITEKLADRKLDKKLKDSLILQQQGNKQQREDIKTHLDKVAEMEAKAQEERLKTYLDYARGAIGERAKIKFEELTKLAEIEKTFTEDHHKDAKRKAEERARKDAEDALKKLDWEEFQKSDTFINLFKDLEGASEAMLTHMIDKLNSFKNSWTDMPLDDMKQIIEKVNELEASLARIKPSETLRDIDKSITAAMAQRGFTGDKNAFFDTLREENIVYETQMNDLANTISKYELYIRLKEEGRDIEADSLGLSVKSISSAKLKLQLNKTSLTTFSKLLLENNNLLATDLERVAALKAQEEALSQAKQMANDLYGSFQDLYKAFGGMEDTDLSVFADMGMNMVNSVLSAIQLKIQLDAAAVSAKGLAATMNTAMGVIGWIVMGVQLIIQAISSIAKSRDNRLVKQIEEAQRKVENLQKAYDKLSEAIDEAWDVAQLKEYYREVEKTTEQLILAQKAAIAAQQQRKGANTVGSDEWNELQDMIAELETFEQQLEEIQESIFSKITAGVLDNVLNVADSWVDAWYDAFKETGDGLSGLEDSFNDMFSSLVKRQAAMKIAGRFVDEWENVLERYAQDSDLSTGEIKAWAEKIKNDLPALNSQLEAFFSSFDSMLNDTEGELTGLQRGIQGITEQQADILASYLNSIRFIIMDSNAQLKLIAAANTNENAREENPMLVQMRIVAQQTTAINTLLNTLVKTGHNMGGNGLKVFI